MEDWGNIKVSEILKVLGGYAFSSSSFVEYGIPLLRIGNIQKGYVDLTEVVFLDGNRIIVKDIFYLKEDDLVIGLTGDLDKVAIIKKENLPLLLNQRVGRFLFIQDVSKKFIYYLFSSFFIQNELSKFFTGGAQLNISPSQIEELVIKIPKSPIEQAKIAEILTEIDESIAQTEALIEKYKSIKAGLMQDLLSKGIDADGKIRSYETHQFKDSPIGKIPLEWEIKTLNECVNPNTIITYGIVQTGKYVEDGVQVLRTIDLKEDYINTENLLRTSIEISNSYKRTLLKEHDIVCNVRASVGDFNIIPKELEGCNLSRGVARISLLNSINPYFTLLFLRSEANKKQMELLIKGTTFIDINIADLRNIKVPIPKSIDEQNRIADVLLIYDKFIKKEKSNLSKLQTTKTGLMQDLLSGRVRVTNLLNN